MASFTNPDNNIAKLALQGDERIAIFGSGAGGHSFAALRALTDGGEVVAIDVRSEMLDRVTRDAEMQHMVGLRTKCADYQRIGGTGMQGNSLDVVVIPNTLFAAQHKEDMLREAARILRPGGRALIIDWRDSFGGMGPQTEHIVSKDDAKELCAKSGFRVSDSFDAGSHHYGLLCLKP